MTTQLHKIKFDDPFSCEACSDKTNTAYCEIGILHNNEIFVSYGLCEDCAARSIQFDDVECEDLNLLNTSLNTFAGYDWTNDQSSLTYLAKRAMM